MPRSYISLIDPPPAGFVLNPAVTLRELRRDVFALYASSIESAERLLAPFIGKISGVVVTCGANAGWEQRGPGLYHLVTTQEELPKLMQCLGPILTLLENEVHERDVRRTYELDLQRSMDDTKRLSTQSFDYHRIMTKEMTERLNAERVMEEGSRWLQAIFNSVNDAIVVFDASTYEILDVNQSTCELFGLTQEEALLVRTSDFSLSAPPHDETRLIRLLDLAASGAPQIFEWHARHKSGRLFWVEANVKVAEIGKRRCLLMVVRDVTARKQAELEKEKLEVQLQQARKMESLGALAGGIAHDFNNLLLVILGNADLIRDAMTPGTAFRDNAESIIKAARRAAELCSQMQTYAGRANFDPRNATLNEVLSEMVPTLQAMMSKKVVLSFNYAEKMPPVLVDRIQIRQAILNLVINAVEAIGQDYGEVVVSTGVRHCRPNDIDEFSVTDARPEGDYAYVEVKDTGRGIEPAFRSKIFDPFFSTKFAGRGLGLAAVLGIVKGHNGAVMLSSDVGKGTSFQILLPALQGDVPAMAAGDSASGVLKPPASVLIVDDEENVRTTLVRVLKALGYPSIPVPSGQAALDVLSEGQKPIGCVLLDMNMPGMDGRKTFAEIRKIKPELPVIVASGFNDYDADDTFAGKPKVEIIQKPFKMADLKMILRNLIGDAHG